MKHWMSRIACALGLLAVALACAIATPAIAKADVPDVMLKDMTSIRERPWSLPANKLIDNYDNTYTSAIGNADYHCYMQYLLDGKYSRFTGTLYIPKGETSNMSLTLTITADGKEIYGSPIMTKTSKPVSIDVDVRGCNNIQIDYSPSCSLLVGLANAGFHLVKPSEADPINPSGQNIFRMYNPYNGEHLYTVDTNEADSLLSHGWKWEGTSSVPKSGSSVYRLCNPYSGEHLYTTDFNEYKTLSSGGWNGEGEKFYSSDSSGKPFYRIYNPWGSGVTAHTYTADTNELDTLTRGGWKSDGVCWYGIW